MSAEAETPRFFLDRGVGTNAHLTGPKMLARLIQHEAAVFRWARRTRPPFVLGLGPTTATRFPLRLP